MNKKQEENCEDSIDSMTRDFTTVHPKTKSEVRRRLMALKDISYREGFMFGSKCVKYKCENKECAGYKKGYNDGWMIEKEQHSRDIIEAKKLGAREALEIVVNVIEKLQIENKEAKPADYIEEVDEQAYDAALRDVLSILQSNLKEKI